MFKQQFGTCQPERAAASKGCGNKCFSSSVAPSELRLLQLVAKLPLFF